MNFNIYVPYSLTEPGIRAMRYALAFAGHLQTSCLIVAETRVHHDMQKWMRRETHREWEPCKSDDIIPNSFQQQSILIQASARGEEVEPHFHIPDVHILYPKDEDGLRLPEPLTYLVPFGNGRSGLSAIRTAGPLARTTQARIILAHTTWPNPDMPTEAPARHHLHPLAKSALTRLDLLLSDLRVSRSELIAMEDSVPDFIVRTALANHCSLIVCAKNPSVNIGGHAADVVRRSPVPVLVACERPTTEPPPSRTEAATSHPGDGQ